MKMKVKIFLFLFISLALLGAVSAIDTPVTIKTVPNYNMKIAFLVPDSVYGLLGDGLVYATADSTGQAKVTFSTSRENFEVKIWLKYDGETIMIKRFDEVYDSGVPLELELYPAWYTPPVKETETTNETEETETVNETNATVSGTTASTTEESEETPKEETQETTPIENVKVEKEKVTAFSVQDGKVSISAKGFLYLLGLVVLAVLIFLGIKHSHHVEKKLKEMGGNKKKKEIKVKKMSEMQNQQQQQNMSKSERLKSQEEKIENAKKMIEEAQEEINKMKNPRQDKIDEIKRKLVEDEKELIRLRRESGEIV